MTVIIDIKLYTVSCESSGIFYRIFDTIHDHLCSHWNKRIGSIYC